jgi:hypothetical protein
MSNNGLNLPDIDIDLSGNDITAFGGGGGPRLPPGTFTMDVVSAEQGTSKKGGPTCKVTFKVADEGEFFGVEVFNTYSLQTKPSKEGGTPAIGRFKNLMMAAGCDLDKIRLSQLVGSRVFVDIIHVEGEGKLDASGNVQPGSIYSNVVNEKAIPMEEVEAPPPPPTAKKAVAAAPAATKNGSVARRA